MWWERRGVIASANHTVCTPSDTEPLMASALAKVTVPAPAIVPPLHAYAPPGEVTVTPAATCRMAPPCHAPRVSAEPLRMPARHTTEWVHPFERVRFALTMSTAVPDSEHAPLMVVGSEKVVVPDDNNSPPVKSDRHWPRPRMLAHATHHCKPPARCPRSRWHRTRKRRRCNSGGLQPSTSGS